MSKRVPQVIKALGLAAVLGVAGLGAYAQAQGPDGADGADMPPPPMHGAPGHGGAPGRPGAGPMGAPHAGPAFGPAMGPGLLMGQGLKEAGVSEAQREQIKKIFEAARADLKKDPKELMEARKQQHEQMLALFAAPTLDVAAIEAQRQQMSAQHEAMAKRMSQAFIDAAKVLTPEQRAKLVEQVKKREARMAERMKDKRGARGERGGEPRPPREERRGQ